jgi:capsular exopolysaccharide synthesis family protein
MSRRTEIVEVRRAEVLAAPYGIGDSSAPGSGADPLAGDEQPVNIFEQVHRLLRGRYLVAIPLALILGAAGAVAGWMHRKPVYFSTGMIRIEPTVSSITGEYMAETRELPMYRDFLQLQAMRLRQALTIAEAQEDPEWQALGRGGGPGWQRAFRTGLSVGINPRVGFLIDVTYMDPDPRAAKVGVDCLLRAYMALYGREASIDDPATLQTLEAEHAQHRARLDELTAMIRRATVERYGSDDLTVIHKRYFDEQSKIDDRLAELRRELAMRQTKADAPRRDLTAEEIGAQDDRMQAMLLQQESVAADLRRFLERGMMERHPDVVAKRQELEQIGKRIENYRRAWNRHSGYPVAAAPGSVAALSDEQLVTSVRNHEELLEGIRQKMIDVATSIYDVDRWRLESNELRGKVAGLEQRLDQIRIQIRGQKTGRIKIEAEGQPAEIKDTRPKWAAAGFVAGAGGPVVLCLLWGLIAQRRYRYSDEADHLVPGGTLLGILPNLPRNLADPEEAAAAAHCVHRIRSILQIAGPSHRVYAVTSSTAGDGKTSLTLSLGLSYAASGSRTLLVDFDMIGGGLTSSLNARTDQGLAEVLASGVLNGHIVQTRTAGLFLLPIGRNDQRFASRLSAPMVRRLLDAVRDQYDVVLVDTGPILGSLEAAFVTSAADGVILVIGRGQHRHYVDKAIGQIRAVGGHLLGLVFNRATAFDFKKSVTSASIRSVGVYPADGPGPAKQLGPVARVIAQDVEGPGGEAAGRDGPDRPAGGT